MNKFFLGILTFLVLQFTNTHLAYAGIPIKEKVIMESSTKSESNDKNTISKLNKKKSWLQKIGAKLEPSNNSKALAIVLAIFIPFLGVAIWQDAVTRDFWIALLLTLLLYIPGLIYALSIILNDAR